MSTLPRGPLLMLNGISRDFTGFLRRKRSMELAARLPAPKAEITVLGPVKMSPPVKIPTALVCNVPE